MTSTESVQRHPGAVPQLHDYLERAAARVPDKIALVCQDRRVTYAEIDAQANQFAHALVRRGVRRGDRVVVFGDNTVETVVAFWGILKANAIASVVSPLTKDDKLAHVLRDCGATVLVSEAHLARVFVPAAAAAPHVRHVLVSGSLAKIERTAQPRLESWDEALAAERGDARPIRRNTDTDVAAIIYTSGSTGEPKGIMLTHRNMLTAATSITTYLGNIEDDVILNGLPLSFDYGLYQVIMAFRMGARVILERSFAFPAQILKTLVREQVTGFPGVPTVFAMMAELKNLSDYDFSHVRYVTNTAAALSVKHIDFIRRTFSSARMFSMYGLTECKRCTYLPPEDIDRKPLSVGIAIPNTELWLVDEHDNRLGPGQVGQLVIRGATVMRGYWGKPEATAKKLRPGPLPGELVLYTGDSCRLDEDGYLYFVGRMDEVIKSRGEKVPPEEVERALMKVPGVREAGVIGVPDDLLGQAVKAFVILEDGADLTEQSLKIACQGRLESFMVPKHVVFVTSLPRTTTGKIARSELS